MTNEEIFNKICVLRDMQKRYFKTRNSEVLKKCKELEKEITNIEKYINGIDPTQKVDWTDVKNNYDTLAKRKSLF